MYSWLGKKKYAIFTFDFWFESWYNASSDFGGFATEDDGEDFVGHFFISLFLSLKGIRWEGNPVREIGVEKKKNKVVTGDDILLSLWVSEAATVGT